MACLRALLVQASLIIAGILCCKRNLCTAYDGTFPREVEDISSRRLVNLDQIDFAKAKTLAEDVLTLITNRFTAKDNEMKQFLFGVQNMPNYGWDIVKYKIAAKILEGDSSFLMVFGGSSVTAGHDNYYREAYPFVFERRMAPIFDAIGVKLLVRNIAHGASNCRPADYCYESMGGEHPDFILWEQSFNCGRDKAIFEYMARHAYWSGAVLYYMASGGVVPQCPKSNDTVPYILEDWTPEKVGLEPYLRHITLESAEQYRKKINMWYDDGNAISKFSSVYGPLYKGVGPHGFNFWGHSSTLCNKGGGCDAVSKIGECYAKGGLHWQTAEVAYYAGEPNRRGRSWHPPTGMHLLRGEVMAYMYVQIVADAFLTVERDLANSDKSETAITELLTDYRSKLAALRLEIPEKALYSSPEESSSKAQCFTDFEPHFNPPQRLSSIVLGDPVGKGDWQHVQNAFTWNNGDTKLGYKDFKPYYESLTVGAEIHFKILGLRHGAIRVCGYGHKDSLANAQFYLDPDYPFTEAALNPQFDPTVMEVATSGHSHEYVTPPREQLPKLPEYSPTGKQFLITETQYIQDECTRLYGLPSGDHVLTIKVDHKQPRRTNFITHVVVF